MLSPPTRCLSPLRFPPEHRRRAQVKLADFGLCRQLSVTRSCHTMSRAAGSRGWQSREMLLAMSTLARSAAGTASPEPEGARDANLSLDSARADCFALGCVLTYLFTRGAHPFGAREEPRWPAFCCCRSRPAPAVLACLPALYLCHSAPPPRMADSAPPAALGPWPLPRIPGQWIPGVHRSPSEFTCIHPARSHGARVAPRFYTRLGFTGLLLPHTGAHEDERDVNIRRGQRVALDPAPGFAQQHLLEPLLHADPRQRPTVRRLRPHEPCRSILRPNGWGWRGTVACTATGSVAGSAQLTFQEGGCGVSIWLPVQAWAQLQLHR